MHLVDLIRYRLLTTVESSDFSWMEHGQWQRSLVVRFTMSPNAAGRQNRTRAGLGRSLQKHNTFFILACSFGEILLLGDEG